MSIRVLIADDADMMRAMLRDILAAGDMEVVGEAANGVEAVDLYRDLSPDLVIMDIVMPLKSGIEATREIKELSADARIIMCSALGQESLVTEALDAGAQDYVVKPFEAGDVMKVINKIVAA